MQTFFELVILHKPQIHSLTTEYIIMIGKTILNYKIISLIGEGGMGTVYLAEHAHMARKVAIKVLLPQLMKHEQIRQRFKNEAATMAHLQHPNIVSLIDYYEDEAGLYLIMEYVEGVTLDNYIKDVSGPLPEEKAIPLMTQILDAFSYAHEKQIIHRDIKPGNIILTPNGTIKILDFGIARIIGDGNQQLTKTGVQLGTVYYMSPEQVKGLKLDHRADIYSLGVTFYQMLTGVQPYNNLTTEYEIYNQIVNVDLPDPSEIYPGVPEYLNRILKVALNKNPNDRFPNCAAFKNGILEKKTLLKSEKSIPIEQRSKNEEIKSKEIEINNQSQKLIAKSKNNFSLSIATIFLSLVPIANFLVLVFGPIVISNSSQILKQTSDHDIKSKANRAYGNAWISIGIFIVFNLILGLIVFNGIQNGNDADRINEYEIPNSVPETDDSGYEEVNTDYDGDGVSNNYDNCPNESGSSDNNGCPYQIYCGSCNSQWVEQNISAYSKISCQNCGEELTLCKRNDGMYGITNGDVYDGPCDCSDCWDEE